MKIALISQWPQIKNAEYELIEKIKRLPGIEFYVIDYLGYEVETKKRLTSKELDFAIVFHYDTPHYVDCVTYCAILNPLEYMLLNHMYEARPSANYRSHDFYVMAKSTTFLKFHLLNLIQHNPVKANYVNNIPEFYPAVSEASVMPVVPSFNKIFYCGTNWEKVKDSKGRHEDLLKLLDKEEIIEIYGPLTAGGKFLWQGYTEYKGSIPFDGVSLLNKIHEMGICLVLSSEVHYHNETASSRIYEACAAGAIIISDNNPFIVREFGDTVLYFDKTKNIKDQYATIIQHYTWIQQNSEAAAKLAAASQALFLKKFTLDHSLKNIIEHYKQHSNLDFQISNQSSKPKVNIIIRLLENKIDNTEVAELIANVVEQDYYNKNYLIILNKKYTETVKKILEGKNLTEEFKFVVIEDDIQFRRVKKGNALSKCVDMLDGEYFAILEPNWRWSFNHLTRMVRQAMLTSSPMIISGAFVDPLTTAPENVDEIKRYFDVPSYLEIYHNVFIQIPLFLISKTLLEAIKEIICLVEYQEVLFLYCEAKRVGELGFSESFSVKKLESLPNEQLSLAETEDYSFWDKVSSPLGFSHNELKILYDRTRYTPLFNQYTYQLLFKDLIQSQTCVPLAGASYGHAVMDHHQFGVLFIMFMKDKFKAVYYVLRTFYRMCCLVEFKIKYIWMKFKRKMKRKKYD